MADIWSGPEVISLHAQVEASKSDWHPFRCRALEDPDQPQVLRLSVKEMQK